jgi:hypothetical protein
LVSGEGEMKPLRYLLRYPLLDRKAFVRVRDEHFRAPTLAQRPSRRAARQFQRVVWDNFNPLALRHVPYTKVPEIV